MLPSEYNIYEEPEKDIVRNNGCDYDIIKNELIKGNCENSIPETKEIETQCIVCGSILYCDILISCDC